MTLGIDKRHRTSYLSVLAADTFVVFRKASGDIEGYSRVQRIIAAIENVEVPGLVGHQFEHGGCVEVCQLEDLAAPPREVLRGNQRV